MKSSKDLMKVFDWDNPAPHYRDERLDLPGINEYVEEDYDTELNKMLELAGVKRGQAYDLNGNPLGENLSLAGNEKAQIQKEKGIEPGTDEWFRLWFSQPHLTGDKGYDED
jgi:hypothetical protein